MTVKTVNLDVCVDCGAADFLRSIESAHPESTPSIVRVCIDRGACRDRVSARENPRAERKASGAYSPITKAMPSICFATMCKNESHCIRKTLEAVAPYVDRILVYDTGSTDGTGAIAEQFFVDTGIHGEVYYAEWEGFAVSKTKMMALAKDQSDYILHVDADDVLLKLDPEEIRNNKHAQAFSATLTRGTSTWKATVLYDGHLTWRFCGVAHTIIRCVENPSPIIHDLPGCLICADEVGVRAADPDKYAKDAALLVQQYIDTADEDPDGLHSRSAFYAAQSFFDAREYQRAYDWYATYLAQARTWIEEVFEAKLRRGRCAIALGVTFEDVQNHFALASHVLPDRAEPYLYFGRWCNQQSKHEIAYEKLKLAQGKDLATVQAAYVLFVDRHAYGKYVNDELAVACYWTGRYPEGVKLVEEIVDDPDFSSVRERLVDNLRFLNGGIARLLQSQPNKMIERAGRSESKTEGERNTAKLLFDVTSSPSRIIVADDFYVNPLTIRTFALSATFVESEEYHRGKRTLTSYKTDAVRAEFERLMGRKITKWNYGTNGVFQICTAKDPIVYHADTQEYAAVVYLTPHAPADAGTSFFRCKGSGARSIDQRPEPKFERGFYDRTQFDLIDQIGNVYNRCVIWDAHLLHAATSYFGSTDANGRLFQMFFFDVES